MRLGYHSGSIVWIDAKDTLDCQARYINDPLCPLAYNVKFVKHPEGGYADVISLRDIFEGEEIWVDYGKGYWRGVGYAPGKLGMLDVGRFWKSLGVNKGECGEVVQAYDRWLEMERKEKNETGLVD